MIQMVYSFRHLLLIIDFIKYTIADFPSQFIPIIAFSLFA